MDESGEPNFLEKMEDERSAGLLLFTIGFSRVIVAEVRPRSQSNLVETKRPVSAATLNADIVLSQGLADAPQKTLALFADIDGRTVYAGEKEKVEGLAATLKLGPVEVILDDKEHNIPNRHYILLSLTERDGRPTFNIYPKDAPAEATFALVDFLRKRRPRPAF